MASAHADAIFLIYTGNELKFTLFTNCCMKYRRVDFPKKGTKKAAISGNGKYHQTKPK
jgi:hypothetical protein